MVVDLWAPWCGPCKTLGPILEKVVDETDGKVELVKINVDENPQASAAFRVQSIPAVYAVRDHQIVNGFIGAQGESAVRQFVEELLPSETETKVAELVAAGDEASLRSALELDPGNEPAVVALAELLVEKGESDEALALLERIPETRRDAAGRGAGPRRRRATCRGSSRRGGHRQARCACSTRSRTTTTRGRTSSTSSSCSAPTTHAPPTIARP